MLEGDRCIFGQLADKLGQASDCSGRMTQHHVRFRCEGGSNEPSNLIPMCESHQKYVHSKSVWGDEDFSGLRQWKSHKKGKRGPGRYAN